MHAQRLLLRGARQFRGGRREVVAVVDHVRQVEAVDHALHLVGVDAEESRQAVCGVDRIAAPLPQRHSPPHALVVCAVYRLKAQPYPSKFF